MLLPGAWVAPHSQIGWLVSEDLFTPVPVPVYALIFCLYICYYHLLLGGATFSNWLVSEDLFTPVSLSTRICFS